MRLFTTVEILLPFSCYILHVHLTLDCRHFRSQYFWHVWIGQEGKVFSNRDLNIWDDNKSSQLMNSSADGAEMVLVSRIQI